MSGSWQVVADWFIQNDTRETPISIGSVGGAVSYYIGSPGAPGARRFTWDAGIAGADNPVSVSGGIQYDGAEVSWVVVQNDVGGNKLRMTDTRFVNQPGKDDDYAGLSGKPGALDVFYGRYNEADGKFHAMGFRQHNPRIYIQAGGNLDLDVDGNARKYYGVKIAMDCTSSATTTVLPDLASVDDGWFVIAGKFKGGSSATVSGKTAGDAFYNDSGAFLDETVFDTAGVKSFSMP